MSKRLKFKLVFLSVLSSILFLNSVFAQQKLNHKGYLKDLRTIDIKSSDSILVRSLIHNRFNFKYNIANGLKLSLEVRNRLFYGDLGASPDVLAKDFEKQNDYFNLSFNPIKQDNLLLNIMIDRVFVEWQKGDFELRMGRQRINWGINLFWNPNDIYNTYSFYDFDYEERPGSDVLLLRYYTGMLSKIEMAISLNDDFDQSTIAGMWKFNTNGYDIQFIAGKQKKDMIVGTGWAGNILDAGFKGEYTFFYPYESDTLKQIHSMCLGGDYSFSEKFYLNTELLYCSNGKNSLGIQDFNNYISSPLSSNKLSPTKFTYAIQPLYNINPKNKLSLSAMWFIGENAYYISPAYAYEVVNNLDFSLVGQLIISDITGKYAFDQALLSLRIKWSF